MTKKHIPLRPPFAKAPEVARQGYGGLPCSHSSSSRSLGHSAKEGKRIQIRLDERQKELFGEVARYALTTLVVGAALAIILFAPNALQMFAPLGKHERKFKEKDFEKVKEKLIKDRYVRFFEKDGKEYLEITEKGRRKLIEYEIDTIKIQEQKWDGRWRIVAFDIPEKMKIARDVLRDKLKEIGFIKLQKSLWICPFECQNEISFIASVYEVEKNINYLVVEKIDNEQYLKNRFNL